MPAIKSIRRILLTLVACFAFASVSIAPALGSPAQSAKRHHHKTKHHKKKSCGGDRDGDKVEPHSNDGDGCGV